MLTSRLASLSCSTKLSSKVGDFTSELFSATSKSQFLSNFDSLSSNSAIGSSVKQYGVLVPMIDVQGEPSLLYTKRSSNLSSHRGLASFPGGGMEDKDDDIIHTAKREAWEEVGIAANDFDFWSIMNPFPYPLLFDKEVLEVNGGKGLVTPVVGVVRREVKDLIINKDEVAEVFTIKLSDLCNPKLHGYTQFRKGPGYSLPVYWGGSHVVWGLTAVITYQFLSALLGDMYIHNIEKTV